MLLIAQCLCCILVPWHGQGHGVVDAADDEFPWKPGPWAQACNSMLGPLQSPLQPPLLVLQKQFSLMFKKTRLSFSLSLGLAVCGGGGSAGPAQTMEAPPPPTPRGSPLQPSRRRGCLPAVPFLQRTPRHDATRRRLSRSLSPSRPARPPARLPLSLSPRGRPGPAPRAETPNGEGEGGGRRAHSRLPGRAGCERQRLSLLRLLRAASHTGAPASRARRTPRRLRAQRACA